MKTIRLLLIVVLLLFITVTVSAQTATPECQSSICESPPPVACYNASAIAGMAGLYFERKRNV